MKRIVAIFSSVVMVALALFASRKTQDEKTDTTPLPLALGALHPRISPDGKLIAVSYQSAIWIVPTGGGVMTRLSGGGEGFDHEPAWSPDGTRIVFVRGPNQLGGDLRIVSAADGTDIPLPKPVNVRGAYNFQKLEFSPDGRRLLGVYRAEGKDHGLAWYDLSTGAVQSLDVPIAFYNRYAL